MAIFTYKSKSLNTKCIRRQNVYCKTGYGTVYYAPIFPKLIISSILTTLNTNLTMYYKVYNYKLCMMMYQLMNLT